MSNLVAFFNNPVAASVIGCCSVFIWSLCISTTWYEINGMRVRWGRSLACALLVSATIILVTEYLVQRVFPTLTLGTWLWTLLYALAMYRNPLWLLVCGALNVAVLGIPWRSMRNQLVALFCAYQLMPCVSSFCETVFWVIVYFQRISYAPDNAIALHMYLIDDLFSINMMAIGCIAWVLLRRYIKANRHKVKLFAEQHDRPSLRAVLTDGALIAMLWVVTGAFVLANNAIGDYVIAVQLGYSFALVLLHVLVIYLSYYLKLRDLQSKYLMEANHMLMETIDSFRGIKHDFNNILQTYDGYFSLEDYEGLRHYHEVLRGKTIAAGERLTLQKALVEMPALLGLIWSTNERAEAAGVSFDCMHMDMFRRLEMPEFDLCRVLGILLNNAVEHAAQTRARAVTLSVKRQARSRGIVIVSNSVDGKIDVEGIFREGFTTKPGHSGHGLAEVNKILSRYYGCTILPNCTDDTFTMFLSVPMLSQRGEKGLCSELA